ncbi:MAG: hypothetical protein COA54_06615 [Thiotrichaceae bacterium]|nr:MAG: hypothetical protein COA54_06615 [Thiotrichaceae bacterium]
MEETYRILNRVGIALCLVGVIDIIVFIYCARNDINYSSSFNIFAVVAGLFLIKGSIRVARIITLFSAFLLAAFVGLLITFPLMQPVELQLIDFKLNPVSRQLSIVFMLLATGFIYWVYRQLSSEPVMLARKKAGLSYGFPKQAVALGIILVAGLSFAMNNLSNSDSASQAKIKANEIYGDTYAYHVTHINNSDGYVLARLTAYNESEIRSVEVKWRE